LARSLYAGFFLEFLVNLGLFHAPDSGFLVPVTEFL
jgi:hypothetical protein